MTEQEGIERLKVEQGAVILAHYHVDPQVQEVANYIGGSFYLSEVAAGLDRRTMVLCSVSFMGESGKLPSPDKVVLVPDAQASCSMVHMAIKEEVEQYRREYPNFAVVCCVNSITEVESWSDVCVTSANTIRIVRDLSNRDILFIPDENPGRYVTSQVPEKHVTLVNGYCPVHDQMPPKKTSALEKIHPNTQILTHPECNTQVPKLANYIGSATGILRFAAGSTSREFIICAENDVHHELGRQNPDKHFYFPDTEPICRDMKEITLDKIVHVLRTGQNQVSVPKAHAPSAGRALEQMPSLAW